ncbi:hypothetical protein BATDEDRAFT_90668 [Batrachochytrium dendrobatidis JAM81]|uniref:Copper acquisition factor BIM1-like domain-containing protein n=1 Tax=Batrachochytrium dendrobatidis (strain JAM81 / FGSC 10211) TaxID=684364 RepID=F4P805_BATDJ|nr:uncharacterized protein BATDEDRAFT_90668 [Batrachochytrium dendrobatidis JAM81]EGF78480.1 hypothetical protein BATDEDRAFT_90668 [Batrachochytrium dendrobatidis JAM81]|eukprot:XP_006680858.1 hypothetical protein BATDEDRAFT_90668 [Batrachochytrium dendrobatidis JAM81]
MTPLSFVLAVLAITQPAMAHFQLMSPAPRIYDDLLELDAPCGGSNTTTVRHPFPIKGGTVTIQAYHPNAAVTFGISLLKAPMTNADFSTPWQPARTIGAVGSYPFANLDMSTISGVAVGTNATLQITFNGGDDITFTAATASSAAWSSFVSIRGVVSLPSGLAWLAAVVLLM